MILDPKRKIKKYATIGAGAFVLVLIAVFAVLKNRTSSPANQNQMRTGESQAEKQKAMLDAIRKANENAPVISPEEQVKQQKEMLDAINKANRDAPKVSNKEASAKQKAMLDAINTANKR